MKLKEIIGADQLSNAPTEDSEVRFIKFFHERGYSDEEIHKFWQELADKYPIRFIDN